MTEAELEAIRLRMRVQVLEILVRGLYTGLAGSVPGAAQGWREKFEALRQDSLKIVLPGILPEYSDMAAAEYQEIIADVTRDIESGFAP